MHRGKAGETGRRNGPYRSYWVFLFFFEAITSTSPTARARASAVISPTIGARESLVKAPGVAPRRRGSFHDDRLPSRPIRLVRARKRSSRIFVLIETAEPPPDHRDRRRSTFAFARLVPCVPRFFRAPRVFPSSLRTRFEGTSELIGVSIR